MTVYGRTGDVVVIRRLAVLEDVKVLERREPDAQDLEALENGSYVVVVQDDGKERLYHQAFLRATDGSVEISKVLGAMRDEQDTIVRDMALAPSQAPPVYTPETLPWFAVMTALRDEREGVHLRARDLVRATLAGQRDAVGVFLSQLCDVLNEGRRGR